MTKRPAKLVPRSERARRYAEDPEYRQRTRDYHRAYRAARKAADPVLYRLKQRAREYARVYGISLEDCLTMAERQGRVCAICRTPGQCLCVDHCHTTGKVRGLLCRKCNGGLGFYFDKPARLRAAAEYLERFRRRTPSRSLLEVRGEASSQTVVERIKREYRRADRDVGNRVIQRGLPKGRPRRAFASRGCEPVRSRRERIAPV